MGLGSATNKVRKLERETANTLLVLVFSLVFCDNNIPFLHYLRTTNETPFTYYIEGEAEILISLNHLETHFRSSSVLIKCECDLHCTQVVEEVLKFTFLAYQLSFNLSVYFYFRQ